MDLWAGTTGFAACSRWLLPPRCRRLGLGVLMSVNLRWSLGFLALCCGMVPASAQKKPTVAKVTPSPESQLWILRPLVRPETPSGVTASADPIDAFIAAEYRSKHLTPVGLADK